MKTMKRCTHCKTPAACKAHEECLKPPAKEPADSGADAPTCSRLITQAELENILTHEGIVEYNAIEDPCGYDNGKTELAVSVAARVLDEIARQKVEAVIRAATAVVDRWETPLWKNAPATATFIHRLRDALSSANALHDLPPPCGSECNQYATGG